MYVYLQDAGHIVELKSAEILDDTHVRINYVNDDQAFFMQTYSSQEEMIKDMNDCLKAIQSRKNIYAMRKSTQSSRRMTKQKY